MQIYIPYEPVLPLFLPPFLPFSIPFLFIFPVSPFLLQFLPFSRSRFYIVPPNNISQYPPHQGGGQFSIMYIPPVHGHSSAGTASSAAHIPVSITGAGSTGVATTPVNR
jgi:hypothetical protein